LADWLCTATARKLAVSRKIGRNLMLRFVLALFLCSACHAVATGASSAQAAANELATCLDPSTTIGAGGDVSDKEIASAQTACAKLQKTTQDEKLLKRINAAAATLASEAKRRGKP
jgi:hypothetical protein